MIDWWLVATAAVWITGLSILLAAFSYHDWLRRETGRRWKDVRADPSWQFPFSGGMLLFCLGMGLGREVAWWERTLWGLLAASFAWQTVTAATDLRRGNRTRAACEPPTKMDITQAMSRDVEDPPNRPQQPLP